MWQLHGPFLQARRPGMRLVSETWTHWGQAALFYIYINSRYTTCIYTYITCTYTYIHIHIHNLYTHKYMYICMLCIYIIYVCIYMYVCVYIYVCVCMYIYIYKLFILEIFNVHKDRKATLIGSNVSIALFQQSASAVLILSISLPSLFKLFICF